MSDTTTVEIAIIGGGVVGSSIAYHLARQGRRPLVIERGDVAAEPAASWASAGGVRRQGRHQAEAALASEAIARWPSLSQELDADLGYRQGGQLLLAESDAEAQEIAAFVQHQHALGFADVRLVDRQEALALVPGLNDRVVAGSYSPADGQADPPRTTRALAAAAQRHGATYWTRTTCLSLITQGDRVTGVRTERGDITAETIVLASGAWSDTLAGNIGLRLPIRTRALQMVLTTPAAPGLLRPVIGALSRPLSLQQLDDGAFFLGGGWLGEPVPDRLSYTLRQSNVEGNWQTARDLLPAVGDQQIARAWCGMEAESLDGIPFIGWAPEHERLYLALGFSGHGFAISPAVGRAVAADLAGQPVPELSGLRPDRITQFDAAAIAAFISEEATNAPAG